MPIPIAVLGYARDRDDVQKYVDALQSINEHQIRKGYAPPFPWDRLTYRRERQETLPGVERLQSAEETYAMGGGDCDDLAPYLAASMRVIDGDQGARAVAVESRGIGYHVVVRRGDGSVIDPSARLGMLVGEDEATTEDRRKRKLHAALTRATSIAKEAGKVYGAPRKAMLAEALRLTRYARSQIEQGEGDE